MIATSRLYAVCRPIDIDFVLVLVAAEASVEVPEPFHFHFDLLPSGFVTSLR